ncbi:EMILIN-2 [Sinocyclocheilus rhinocerous]|uniref:EMILIN-2 n=1 Tax=Sinocyclocheilus rhinocerous TaxID=307959 RepID=UPI0007BA560B|nr:PREDICTED: EMILIN-2 [Sinocyclocheilus rhinocerous]
MKPVLAGCAHFCAALLCFSLISFPLTDGSPSRYSLFQGSAYPSSVSRQRSKNWCAFVVHKNVTCAVLAANEDFMGPQLLPCPPNQPDCTQRLMYHSHMRPMYKIGYKQVTELEWRCCPGYQGHDCTELKNTPQKINVVEEPRQDVLSTINQQQSILGPEVFSETHPWSQPGQKGHHSRQLGDYGERQRESQQVQALEEEVERLSQTVLGLQAMTSANANLRLDLQEDVTKFVLNMLGNLQQPQDVKAGGIESFTLPYDLRSSPGTDELQNHITQLSDTIGTNTNSIQDLKMRIQNIDGQMHRLTEASNTRPLQPSSTAATNECPCQAYIDEKLSALRDELLQGMDIKIADMKNACDYKVLSVQEQCEEQETSYLSLAELLDSKETELRKEIKDLRLQLPIGKTQELDNAEVQKLKDTQQILQDAIMEQNATIAQINAQGHVLEARVSLAEKSAEVHCLYLEEKLRRERLKEEEDQRIAFEEKFSGVQCDNSTSQLLLGHDQRLEVLEKHAQLLQDEVGSLKRDLNQSISFETFLQRVENLEVDSGRSQEQVRTMNGLLDGLDGRVASIDGVCGQFEPMSDSLKRIKDGLNKHVNGLWTCVRQLNSTVLAHTRDINTFKANSHLSKDSQDGITDAPTGVPDGTAAVKVFMEVGQPLPSLASGEAATRVTKVSSHTPQGINGSMPSITGYAGAPGYPGIPDAALSPDSVSAQIPLKTVQMATGVMTYVSFSAGLTLVPFPGEIGIIRFNNVLLNDGRHYDPQTGVFTVPMDGRYLLSAVLTAQAGERVEAFLSVANRNIQKLSTAGMGGRDTQDCDCGGSVSVSLALHLKRGQRTGLVLTSGKLAISASSEILSSFSGVLLYPTVGKR